MRILVTGAAGFIGFHTAARLLDRGDEVVGLDNMSPYYDVSLKEARLARLERRNGFHFIKADLADQEVVGAVFAEEKPERVIHLAAQAGVRYSLQHPHAYIDANIRGFLHVLEGCRHHGVRASRLCLVELGLWREPQAPLQRQRQCRSSGEPLRRDQEGERADGAFLRPSLRPAGDGLALLHRLRPVGAARHVAVSVHPQHSRRQAHPGVQLRPPRAGLHLYRRRGGRRGAHVATRSPRPTRIGVRRIQTPRPRPRRTGSTISAITHPSLCSTISR